MMINNNDVVTLFSNAQPKLFPQNKAYSFTNRLPHLWKIPEGERWRVGVSEFSTLDTLDTIPVDLTLNVSLAHDYLRTREVDRFPIFQSGITEEDQKELSVSSFQERVDSMQRYCHPIPPEYTNCTIPWNKCINGLGGVSRQMMSQSGYDTYLLFVKTLEGAEIGVKHGDTLLSDDYNFILSPALQHLLKLENPTGVQALKSIDDLKSRFVSSKSGNFCDFWYKIAPTSSSLVYWDIPHLNAKTVGEDPFRLMEELGQQYSFFDFQEQSDEKETIVKLKFTEASNVAMVEFPANFLQLAGDDVTFKLGVSDPQYEIVDGDKKKINDAFPLGQHMKNGKNTTFFMTHGSEIRLSRKTSVKSPKGYVSLTDFKLKIHYGPNKPLVQHPYSVTYRIPKGNYTLDSFITKMRAVLYDQNTFNYSLTPSKNGSGGGRGKRIKLTEDATSYEFSMTPLAYGYKFTFDSRFQSILALDRAVIAGGAIRTVKSSRSIKVSSFTYNLMLYCNFTKPCIQGGQLEKVLRTIPFPTKNEKGENFVVEFKHVHFQDLNLSQLQDLMIEIRDDTGEIVHFNEGRTMLKLVFIKL